MQDLLTVYKYIKNKYNNYKKIKYIETEILIIFHDKFEMKIREQNYFNFYFNNIFYYNIDWQDVKDTIDDIFTNQYVFCEQNKKLKIMYLKDFYNDTKYNHIWTIEKTLK